MQLYPHYRKTLIAIGMLLLIPAFVNAQDRDVRGERIIIDDNGSDGTVNTLTLELPSLAQDLTLTISDPGNTAAQLLLAPDGSAGAWLMDGNGGTTAGTHFLGTADATALYLYVNSGAGNSLILNTNGSIQRDNAGNARGTNATDLQMLRTDATQVASGDYATISGGRSNIAAGLNATVGGGNLNNAASNQSTIGGGFTNTTSGLSATVGGGHTNTAAEDYATVSGGRGNTASGEYSAIIGGRGLTLNAAADRSVGFLGGNTGANDMTINTADVAVFGNTDIWLANNDNAASRLRFYEANSTTGPFPGTANYTSFAAQDQTGDIAYLLPAAVPGTLPANDRVLTITDITGPQVTLSWIDNTTLASDRRKKEHFTRLSGEDILEKFDGIELGSWNYRGEPNRHYGIMAQDFYKVFGGEDRYGVIGNDTTVSVIDLHGVSFLAIQGLEMRTSKNTELISANAGEIDRLTRENADLHAEISRLRSQVMQLRGLETRLAEIEARLTGRQDQDPE